MKIWRNFVIGLTIVGIGIGVFRAPLSKAVSAVSNKAYHILSSTNQIIDGTASAVSAPPNGSFYALDHNNMIIDSFGVATLSPYTGSVGITGNQGTGSDFINQVSVNNVATVTAYGATGSAQQPAGCVVNGNETSLACTGIADFKANQWAMLRGAAPATALTTPTAPTITNICQGTGTNCTSGTPGAGGQTTTTGYEIVSFDTNGSWIASTPTTTTTGWNSLYASSAGGQAEKLTGYSTAGAFTGFYKNEFGHYYLLDIEPASVTTWYDWGSEVPRFSGNVPWSGLYPDPDPGASGLGDVLAQISSITGSAGSYTVNLTNISPTMTGTPTLIAMRHDDTVNYQTALSDTTYQTMFMPPGTYYVHGYSPAGSGVIPGTSLFQNQDNYELYGTGYSDTKIEVNSALWQNWGLNQNGVSVFQSDGRAKQSSIGTVTYNYAWASANNLCPSGALQCSGGIGGSTCTNCSGSVSTSNYADYAITAPVTIGSNCVSTSTANAGTFSQGDDILLRTGDVGQGQPDAEYNSVAYVDTVGGQVCLALPTAKPYAQEYYNSGASGATSQLQLSRTPAPFGIEKVNLGTIHNIKLYGFAIYGLPNHPVLDLGQSINAQIYNMDLRGGNLNLAGLEGANIHDNLTYTYDLGAEGFSCDTKNGRDQVVRNKQIAIEPMTNQVTEGCYNYTYAQNEYDGPLLINQRPTAATFSATGTINGTWRGYSLNFADNTLINCAPGAACISEGSADLWTVGDHQTYSGIISGNIFSSNIPNVSVATTAFALYGDNWGGLISNTMIPPLAGFNLAGQAGGMRGSISAILSIPAANQPQAGQTTMTATLGPIIPPNGAIFTACEVYVTTAFNGGTDTIAINYGTAAQHPGAMAAAVAVVATGLKTCTIVHSLPSSAGVYGAVLPITATYSGLSAPTTGNATIELDYVMSSSGTTLAH